MKGYIYKIQNTKNGKFYVGSTVDFNTRKQKHLYKLRKDVHENKHLQNSWNKHGEKVFEFKLLFKTEYPRKYEQLILNIIDTSVCYNICMEVDKPPSFKGKKNGNWKGGITKLKQTCPNCGNYKVIRAKLCSNCIDKSGDNNPFYGKSHNKEFLDRMSENRKGQYNGNQEKPVIAEGGEYKSLSECARQYDVVPATILNRIKSNNFPEFNYK